MIDVALLEDHAGVIYSMDVFREGFTTTSISSTEVIASRDCVGVHSFTQNSDSGTEPSTLGRLAAALDQSAKSLTFLEYSGDKASLYSLESLRKRGQED